MTHQQAAAPLRGFLLRGLAALLVLAASLAPLSARPAHAQLPTPTPSPTAEPQPPLAGADRPQFVPGELLVGVRQAPGRGFSAAPGMAVAAAVNAQVAATFDVTGPDDDVAVHLLQVPPGYEYAYAEQLVKEPTVVYVELNGYAYAAQEGDLPGEEPLDELPPGAGSDVEATVARVEPGYVVDDPLYATGQWALQRIHAARAWQLAYTSAAFGGETRPVIVSVLDSGIDPTQADFKGRLLPGKNYEPNTDTNGDGFVGGGDEIVASDVRDFFGHGTHVAGVIAAGLNDGVGMAGVAPTVKIDPRRVLGNTGGGRFDRIARAIIEATDAGAHVINMSFEAPATSQNITLRNAIAYAANQGVLLVAAAGNNGSGVMYPANQPEVIAVGALTLNDSRALYSNEGPELEISAPGGDKTNPVLSTWSKQATTTRCETVSASAGGVYCGIYGTSMAAPVVAGVAALLFSLDPDLSAAQARTILRQSAAPLPELATAVGAGKVDALAAVRSLLPSRLELVSGGFLTETTASTAPFTVTVRVDNPSPDPIDWRATLDAALVSTEGSPSGSITPTVWITLTSGLTGTQQNTQTGTVRYGAPGFLTLVISPTQAMSGTYGAALGLRGTRSDGSSATATFNVTLLVHPAPPTSGGPGDDVAVQFEKVFLPIVLATTVPKADVQEILYSWAIPTRAADRTTHTLTDTAVVELTQLPVTLALGRQPATRLRIYADGFVAVPAAGEPLLPFTPVAANRCVPSLAFPANAVYGWWSDLNPGASGARVSSFALGSDRFVVEYRNVPLVGVFDGAGVQQRVSLQIVLHKNGNVQLNFARLPRDEGRPGPATVGVETHNALFYSLLGCATPDTVLGELPTAGRSYLIEARDIY